MNNPFAGREPKRLYDFLFDIFSIPRPSFHEEKMAEYVISFAKSNGLNYYTDDMHNVLVYKNGSKGMENLPPIMLEGHMDIVPVKTSESEHDFLKDPVELIIDGEWVKAKNTTLGADNGCAIAIMLAILEDNTLVHPPLECLFTVQEEVGMYGVKAFDISKIHSRRIIGLDAGEEGVFRKGVSSKYKNRFEVPINRQEINKQVYELKVKGLKGGSPSVGFCFDRACAIKIMGVLLHKLVSDFDAQINYVDKSENRGIAEDCYAQISISANDEKRIYSFLQDECETIRSIYAESEPDIMFELMPCKESKFSAMTKESSRVISNTLFLMPTGAPRRVLGRENEQRAFMYTRYVKTTESSIIFDTVISSDKRAYGLVLQDEMNTFYSLFGGRNIDNKFEFGWDPEENSEVREKMLQSYIQLFSKEPVINVSHGCNDCVVIKERIPDFDVVTTAATYLDYHTVNERLDMKSFEKVYALICKTLENLCN